MTHVTCRLTAKNRDQLRNPTLGNRVWDSFFLSLTYLLHHGACHRRRKVAQTVSKYQTHDSSVMVVKVRRHPDVQKAGDDRWLVDQPRIIKRYDDVDDENGQQFLLQTLHHLHTACTSYLQKALKLKVTRSLFGVSTKECIFNDLVELSQCQVRLKNIHGRSKLLYQWQQMHGRQLRHERVL